MKKLRACIATAAAAQLCACTTGGAPKSSLPDLEQKLGKGWQCFAMPNGFGRVGVVFEQKPDKSVFYLDDTKSAPTATAPMAIGTLTTSKNFSIAAGVDFLRLFFPSLDASYDYSTKISVTIGGAEEQVGGLPVQTAAEQWASEHLSAFSSGARLFVIRETVLASEITYAFDKATSTAISAKLGLSAAKSAPMSTPAVGGGKSATADGASTATKSSPSNGSATTPGGSSSTSSSGDNTGKKQSSTVSPPDASQRISQKFDPKIGICIHPDQIVMGNNFGGVPKPNIVEIDEALDFRFPLDTR